MNRKTVKYTEGEIGKVKVVKDFLPPPDKLVMREANVKVTLSLSQRSVDFFKREAGKRRVPYQRMIRALVDAYAEREEKRPLERARN
jgi:predicted DNA binding CopG/RHH family protein